MNMNVTKKEYKLLLDMLSIADWIMHAYAIKKTDYHQEHEVLKNKLLSYFKEMDAEDIIESSDEHDFYETSNYETYIQNKFIQPYDDKYFWDTLVERLAERDLINSVGMEAYSKMNLIDRMTKLDKTKDKYINEFKKNGLNNLKLNIPF